MISSLACVFFVIAIRPNWKRICRRFNPLNQKNTRTSAQFHTRYTNMIDKVMSIGAECAMWMVRATLPPYDSLKTININVNHHLSYHFYWITVPTCRPLSLVHNKTNELITFWAQQVENLFTRSVSSLTLPDFNVPDTKPEVIFLKWDTRSLHCSTTMRISIKNNFHHISHCMRALNYNDNVWHMGKHSWVGLLGKWALAA